MPERTSYEPGTPCWVDIGVPDMASRRSLLRRTARMDAREVDDPEAGGYGQFHLKGLPVAGVGPQQNTDEAAVLDGVRLGRRCRQDARCHP